MFTLTIEGIKRQIKDLKTENNVLKTKMESTQLELETIKKSEDSLTKSKAKLESDRLGLINDLEATEATLQKVIKKSNKKFKICFYLLGFSSKKIVPPVEDIDFFEVEPPGFPVKFTVTLYVGYGLPDNLHV